MAILIFVLLYGLLTIPLLVGLVMQTGWWGFPTWFFLWHTANFIVAYDAARVVIATFNKGRSLSSCQTLTYYPPVAVIYLTRDDLIPSLVKRLRRQSYPNYQIFVLDDSQNTVWKQKVDKCGERVLRRTTRECQKAGNINHWFDTHSEEFDYVIVLDNDVVLPDDFISRMVCYAEHPHNQNVIIFQSKLFFWNQKDELARLHNIHIQFEHFLRQHTDNLLRILLPTTAFMARAGTLRALGGFSCCLAEDHATGINVLKQGFDCKQVDITAYVSHSAHIKSYRERVIRWGQGQRELFCQNTNIRPRNLLLKLLSAQHFFCGIPCLWILGLSWLITLHMMYLMFPGLIPALQFDSLPRLLPLVVFCIHILYALILRPLVARRIGIPIRLYFRSVALQTATSAYMAVPMLRQIYGLKSGQVRSRFEAEDVRVYAQQSRWQIIRDMPLVSLLILFASLGQIINPQWILLYGIIAFPYLAAPWVLYRSQDSQPGAPQGALSSQDPNLQSWLQLSLSDVYPVQILGDPAE